MIYYVDGLGGPIVTAAANECMGALWNPAGTRRIRVYSASLIMRDWDAPDNTMYLQRITTRGTAGATITPDADNSEDGVSVPPSGFLLDVAEYSVQPTRAAAILYGAFAFPPASSSSDTGSGFVLPLPRGILLKPGTGLGIFEKNGALFSGTWDVNFVVDD